MPSFSAPAGIAHALANIAFKFDGPVIPSDPHIPPNPIVDGSIPPNPIFPAHPSVPIVGVLLGLDGGAYGEV